MDADGNVKIADFGLSTTDTQAGSLAIENLTVSAMLDEKTSGASSAVSDPKFLLTSYLISLGIGTSIYIAPEVAMSRDYGTSADLYSLGVSETSNIHISDASTCAVTSDHLLRDVLPHAHRYGAHAKYQGDSIAVCQATSNLAVRTERQPNADLTHAITP